MLSENEEQRLNSFLKASTEELRKDFDYPEFFATDIRWIANKLKEINEECSKVHLELQKANELSAKLSERYE